MKKQTKIVVVFCLLLTSVFSAAGLTIAGFLLLNPEIVMRYFDRYHDTSEKALISYLEENYDLLFPKSMSDFKAAERQVGFDGSSEFIAKFSVDENGLAEFLQRFGRTLESFEIYTAQTDKRRGDNYPDWFKSPIMKGTMGQIDVRGFNAVHATDIYLDMTDANAYVVYMEGFYKM
jgi:hypothetical protein